LVALDASAEVLEQAERQQAELLVVHHPLIFSGLKRLVDDRGTVTLVRRLIREGRSLIAMHTNLDAAPDGLNTYVARLLGLCELRPLLPSASRPLLKLVVYVPETHGEAVRAAICAAGAGHIGHYSDCTFGTPGTGTFRPEEGTQPFLGAAGQLARVAEVRLETVVPRTALEEVLAALRKAHPYEEVAYDLFSLENPWPQAGLGRIGALATPASAGAFLETVGGVLATDRLAFIGDPARTVRTVALCTGAGGDYLPHAWRQQADLYLTGEVKHHHALLARQWGIAVIDAGHFATERPAVRLFAEYLTAQLPQLHVVIAEERDPLRVV
jgi:dinuclear metal center YbgI/SA1388 family protein